MNAINRRGMKVVCVAEFELVDMSTGALYTGTLPQLEHIYTVDDFIATGPIVECDGSVIGSGANLPGITLREIPAPRQKSGGCIGWPIEGFRPALNRKTDISELVSLCAPTLTSKPVEVV